MEMFLDEMPKCRSCHGEYSGSAIVPVIFESENDMLWPASSKQIKFSLAHGLKVKYWIRDMEDEKFWPEENCCDMCIGKL